MDRLAVMNWKFDINIQRRPTTTVKLLQDSGNIGSSVDFWMSWVVEEFSYIYLQLRQTLDYPQSFQCVYDCSSFKFQRKYIISCMRCFFNFKSMTLVICRPSHFWNHWWFKIGTFFDITIHLWVESTDDRWIPLTKGQWCGPLTFSLMLAW